MSAKKLKALSKKLKALTPQVQERAFLSIVKQNEDIAIGFNQDQLLKGRTADGKSTGTYKSKKYAKYKKTLNPRGVVDLRLKGGFFEGMFLRAEKFPVVFDDSDKKAPMLVKKYGQVLGLAKDNKTKFFKIIRTKVFEYFRRFLGLR